MPANEKNPPSTQPKIISASTTQRRQGLRFCCSKSASYDEIPESFSFSSCSLSRASVLRATASITNTDKGIPANNKASVKTGFVPNTLSSHNPPKTEARMMTSVRHPT